MVSRGLATLSASCGITATRNGRQEIVLDIVKTLKTRPSDDKKRLTGAFGIYTTSNPGAPSKPSDIISYPTVEDHFRKDTDARSLENWLETYQPMIMQNNRHRRTNSDRRLRQIDDVFHLIMTVPPRDPTPTMAPRQRTPTLITRPINTYFPPHRITSPTPTLETTTTTARTTSTSNNPTTTALRPPP
ncbi:hypothetical protein IV203_017168 [Nitzschia inconspicua]|uniref:Uncharacterized protein n=1 Tax=Nitzschia inconspicua TaxID=303405 RepID=A0A9K3PIC3_9STRA|nr:hypothetical protein IV203_017168 [Nitzschia inconspicua]